MIKIILSTKLGELQMSQAQLSRITHIRPATIFELYHNYAESIKVEHLNSICVALACRLDEIMVFIPDDSEEAQKLRAAKAMR